MSARTLVGGAVALALLAGAAAARAEAPASPAGTPPVDSLARAFQSAAPARRDTMATDSLARAFQSAGRARRDTVLVDSAGGATVKPADLSAPPRPAPRDAASPLPVRLRAATHGLRLSPVTPVAQEARERDDRFFRSYPDRLAEAGWIADVDYGYLGYERYLFAPGSPRPPAMSLDGFPVDLGWPGTGALEGWGGEVGGSGRAWWPDPPSAPAPGGALDLERFPAGQGALLTRISMHSEDLGGMDARAQFARQDPDAQWALVAGVRKETESFLLQESRSRGLAAQAARRAGWGSWRAAFLSSTSDFVYYSPDFDGEKVRREVVRLGLGVASRDSVVSATAVLGSASNGSERIGRQGLAARVAPRGLPAGAALLLTLDSPEVQGATRPGAQVSVGGGDWEAAGGVLLGTGPRELRLRGSLRRDLALGLVVGAEGSVRRDLQSPADGSQRLSMLRLEPLLQWRSGALRARVQAFVERDRGLQWLPAAPAWSVLQPAAVREATSSGLQARLECPGPVRTRLGATALVQRTRDELGWRLPYQPPYAVHAFLAADRHTPFVPMLAHLRLTAHAVGERRAENALASGAHVTLDFETVVDYGQLKLQLGFYNFTDLVYDTDLAIPIRPTLLATAPGRSMRFGICWDLWN